MQQQQQQQANSAKNSNSKSSNEQPADPKHIHHSLSDDILNYEHALSSKDSQHYLHLHGYNQQTNKYSTSKPMEKRASPLATPTNQFDTFQTLLNQILSDNQTSNHLMEHIESLNNSSGAQSKAQNLSVNTQMSSMQPKNGLMSPSSSTAQNKQTKAEPAVSDLTQIKYLKNNYNIQYYPSDFINFAQQSENLMNGSGANANQSPTSSLSPAHDKNSATNKKLSDFIVSNSNNNVNKASVAPNKSLSSSSSSTSSSSSSSTKSSSHKPVLLNNNTTTTNNTNAANITSVDVSGFMSSLAANKKSPSPPKSTSSNSNEIQQLLDANTNLKSVKSLTNLYESKFTLASSPNISPPVNANTNNNNNTSNSNLFAAPSSYQQQNSTKMNPSSTIDFNSIFNSKVNNQSGNGNNNPQLQQQQSLLSCSSTSTSSTSSNHPNIDYNNNNNSHHNHSQFQSRSLGAFQNSLKHVNTNNSNNSQEINLSVKNVIKLLENNSTNTLQQQVSAPSGSNYALISGNGNTGGSITSSLSFNKAKRSSSIDNVISSVNNSSAEAQSHPYVKSSPSSSRSKTSSTSNANSTPSGYISSNKNYILNDTDLSELLESLNSNKKKPSYENMLNVDLSNSRSRSLQRDNLNGSYLENIKQQQQQQQQQQQMQQRKKQLSESKPTSGLNNFSSAYNTQTSNGNKYNEDNLSLIILNQSLNANNSSSNTLTSPSSHVVPKPPPGNPQRTTNLYPARFYLIFFLFFLSA